jgi:hypothetical protein
MAKNLAGDAKALLKQLEEAVAECDRLKEDNEKLRKELNSAVMHLIQNRCRDIGPDGRLEQL